MVPGPLGFRQVVCQCTVPVALTPAEKDADTDLPCQFVAYLVFKRKNNVHRLSGPAMPMV
jgi:hypothetical protein